MNRILFTHSYFLRFDPKQWQMMQPYAPLGTIMAAAVVREAGYQPFLWDPMFASDALELHNIIKSVQPDALVIYDDGFNYLTKMCLTNMREAAFKMIGLGYRMNIPVIVCSSDASDHYEKYLDHGATAVIKGEGEITLLETLESLKNNTGGFESIRGIVFRKGNNTIINSAREVLKKLDELPLPAWDLIDTDKYRRTWIKHHGYFSMNMSTTRGCPFKCNWCAKPIYGNRYNSRSPEHVIDEIKFLQDKYRPDHIWFCDDIFGLKPGWVNRFSEVTRDTGIKIKYKIQSRVDLLLQENTIKALAESGCETVWVGAESGSQRVLDAMDKGTKVEQIFEATALLKKHYIKPAFFLQFGYPGETKEDIDKTITMVEALMPDDIGISVSYPLPGTPFYDKVKSELEIKSNWSDSDELAMMFTGTYAPGYYKHLHRYVHKLYRIHQGAHLLKGFVTGKVPTGKISLKRMAGTILHQPGKWYHRKKMKQFSEVKIHPAFDTDNNTREAFDKVAAHYDEEFTGSTIGLLQRKQVYRYLEQQIDPEIYPEVLELNCGTGTDAIWLANRGFNVTATDISAEMIRVAKQKATTLPIKNSPVFTTLSFSDLISLKEKQYDVIFSNFGGLNCTGPQQIKIIAKQAGRLLRPGGKFIAVIMGRNCVLENVYFTLKNKKLSNRRKSNEPVPVKMAEVSFQVWYYTPEEFSALLNPWLSDPVFKPVGLFIPPSFANNYFSKSKVITTGAGILERMLPALPSFANYSDHYLVEATKL